MASYYKWGVKTGFTFVLQFFMLISDGLGGVKMHVAKWILVLATIFEISRAELKSCSEEQEQQTICFNALEGKKTYVSPFPVVLNTQFSIKEIVRIDEDEQSITTQLIFWIIWKDSQIDHSNGTFQ